MSALPTDVRLSPLRLQGTTFDYAGIEQVVIAADLELDLEGASTLKLAVDDPGRQFLQSRLATESVGITVDGRVFVLAQVSKQGNQLTLTFEDAVINELRQPTALMQHASRSKVTRAQFAQHLVLTHAKTWPWEPKIGFWCPELTQQILEIPPAQPKAKRPTTTKKRPRSTYKDPFGKTVVYVKALEATPNQKDNIATVIGVGKRLGASDNVIISAIAAITDESSAMNLTYGDRDSQGLFQQRPSQGWKNVRDREYAATSYYMGANHDGTGAIAFAHKYPNAKASTIAQAIQRSGTPSGANYAAFVPEATATLNAYKGFGANLAPTTSAQRSRRTPTRYAYEFSRHPNETTWDTITRLAREVRWRCFVVGTTVHFCTDDALLAQDSTLYLSEKTPGVEVIDFDIDSGKKVHTAQVTCRMERWEVNVGQTVELVDCGPASQPSDANPAGKWIVSVLRRSLFNPSTEMDLVRPMAPLLEPASKRIPGHVIPGALPPGGQLPTPGRPESNLRQSVVSIAESLAGQLPYLQVRPIPHVLKPGTKTDCSGFATAVYDMAGAPDPNGYGFNGQGSTVSLWPRGARVTSPQPGDLAFFGTPWRSGNAAHVVVCIGSGECMSQGGGRGPKKQKLTDFPGGVVGYRSYLP